MMYVELFFCNVYPTHSPIRPSMKIYSYKFVFVNVHDVNSKLIVSHHCLFQNKLILAAFNLYGLPYSEYYVGVREKC